MFTDLIKNNPRAAQVAVFGNWGSAEDAVYSNWEEKEFDIPALKARDDVKFIFGLDFGFSVSYNAFVAAAIDPMTRTMWIYDELYFKGKTNMDIAKAVIAAGYGKEEIWADSQEGKSIRELQDGFIEMHDSGNGIEEPTRFVLPRIREALKGPDSVRNGIARVNEYHIYVHPTCVNMITELTNYSYSRDKDGRLTDKPEKDYDHLCLVGDTMILTESGQVPLRDIRPGVKVQSHLGLRRVVAWAKTGENVPVMTLRLSDGTELTGTPDHPVFTAEGPTPLGKLAIGDAVKMWCGSGSVADICPSGTADVYSIEVEEAHDYYANHILLGNCDALRYALTGEFAKGHGAVVEAKGGSYHSPRIGSTSLPDEQPINTLKIGGVVEAEGPAGVAPPRKKTVRVFSSIRYDDNGYSNLYDDRPWRGF